jgi:hypothetical protein
MTMRVPIDEDVVALIKAIIHQDRRERHAAGFKQGSWHLSSRIAQMLGVNLHTVLAIKHRKRRKEVKASRKFHRTVTVAPEKLEKIRQQRIRDGLIGASWRGVQPKHWGGKLSYRKRISKAGR